jgi:hypothetical protein
MNKETIVRIDIEARAFSSLIYQSALAGSNYTAAWRIEVTNVESNLLG